ncbi:MAG: glycerol-3-phosphate 1-O-acyltransferase PlsY [Clostridia bacterium]|nr:glycerol-3-phosphate 1-O-acyltransferase PlsY [Clostridia bacterium]
MKEFVSNGIIGANSPIALYILGIVICIVVPYLLGSLNFGVMISNKKYGDDVRTHGSGNAGATNMLRTYGKKAAALTLLGDALKAVVATCIGLFVMPGDEFAYVAALFCMIGHAFPVFFKFKGGKGVVVAAASMLVLNPLVCILCILIFVIIVAFTRYVSLGSIIAAFLFPLMNYRLPVYFPSFPIKTIFCILMGLFIIFLHRKNIVRLFNGTENKFGGNKTEKLK